MRAIPRSSSCKATRSGFSRRICFATAAARSGIRLCSTVSQRSVKAVANVKIRADETSLHAAAERFGDLDLDRVGIRGWSASPLCSIARSGRWFGCSTPLPPRPE